MNRKIGLISSIVICCLVTVFLICLVIALFAQNIFTENLSYGVCTVLSWGWVATTCAYSCFTQKEYSAAAKIGVSIGVIYATIISIVYFTQLTTVLYKSVDEIILQAFSFTSAGSWLFNLDLLGYSKQVRQPQINDRRTGSRLFSAVYRTAKESRRSDVG